eukprot:jgi/Bigna1/80101/fgenesh1_pg.67_\
MQSSVMRPDVIESSTAMEDEDGKDGGSSKPGDAKQAGHVPHEEKLENPQASQALKHQEMENLKTENESLKNQVNVLKREKESAINDLEAERKAVGALRVSLEDARNVEEGLRKELRNARQRSQDQMRSYSDAHSTLKSRLASEKKVTESARQELQEIIDEKRKLSLKLKDNNDELEQLRSMLRGYKKKAEELRKKHAVQMRKAIQNSELSSREMISDLRKQASRQRANLEANQEATIKVRRRVFKKEVFVISLFFSVLQEVEHVHRLVWGGDTHRHMHDQIRAQLEEHISGDATAQSKAYMNLQRTIRENKRSMREERLEILKLKQEIQETEKKQRERLVQEYSDLETEKSKLRKAWMDLQLEKSAWTAHKKASEAAIEYQDGSILDDDDSGMTITPVGSPKAAMMRRRSTLSKTRISVTSNMSLQKKEEALIAFQTKLLEEKARLEELEKDILSQMHALTGVGVKVKDAARITNHLENKVMSRQSLTSANFVHKHTYTAQKHDYNTRYTRTFQAKKKLVEAQAIHRDAKIKRDNAEAEMMRQKFQRQVRESKDKRLKEMAKRAAAAQQQPHRALPRSVAEIVLVKAPPRTAAAEQTRDDVSNMMIHSDQQNNRDMASTLIGSSKPTSCEVKKKMTLCILNVGVWWFLPRWKFGEDEKCTVHSDSNMTLALDMFLVHEEGYLSDMIVGSYMDDRTSMNASSG